MASNRSFWASSTPYLFPYPRNPPVTRLLKITCVSRLGFEPGSNRSRPCRSNNQIGLKNAPESSKNPLPRPHRPRSTAKPANNAEPTLVKKNASPSAPRPAGRTRCTFRVPELSTSRPKVGGCSQRRGRPWGGSRKS